MSILKKAPVQVKLNKELSVVHVAEIPLANKSATFNYYMRVFKISNRDQIEKTVINWQYFDLQSANIALSYIKPKEVTKDSFGKRMTNQNAFNIPYIN